MKFPIIFSLILVALLSSSAAADSLSSPVTRAQHNVTRVQPAQFQAARGARVRAYSAGIRSTRPTRVRFRSTSIASPTTSSRVTRKPAPVYRPWGNELPIPREGI